jgi:polyisoprenyl-phosphate glycosyltransferase
MRHKTFASVVLYTRDEPIVVIDFVVQLGCWLADHFELYEVIVVDGGANPDAVRLVGAAAERHGLNVVVMRLARPHGVEAGIKAGLDRAMGDWVFECESARADFSFAVLDEMYRLAIQGHDVVTASGDDGPLRSRVFYRLVNRYVGLDNPLRTERLRLTSRRTLNAMHTMRERVRSRKVLSAIVGHSHRHIRYRGTTAASGPARRMDRETARLAFDILLSFPGFGLRLAYRLSLTFGALSLVTIGYACGVFVLKSDVSQGWTTIIIVISGGFTGVFLILGLIGEYLARILTEVRARPLYTVHEAVVFTSARTVSDVESIPDYLRQQLRVAEPPLPDEPLSAPNGGKSAPAGAAGRS